MNTIYNPLEIMGLIFGKKKKKQGKYHCKCMRVFEALSHPISQRKATISKLDEKENAFEGLICYLLVFVLENVTNTPSSPLFC